MNPAEYIGLVLPGGRAPEFLRYDQDLIRITKHFFEHNKPVASICHGIEILAAADVIRGRRVTTIPRCRLDAEFSGATYVAEGLVIDGNLYCCRFKKECAPWMKALSPHCAARDSDISRYFLIGSACESRITSSQPSVICRGAAFGRSMRSSMA